MNEKMNKLSYFWCVPSVQLMFNQMMNVQLKLIGKQINVCIIII